MLNTEASSRLNLRTFQLRKARIRTYIISGMADQPVASDALIHDKMEW